VCGHFSLQVGILAVQEEQPRKRRAVISNLMPISSKSDLGLHLLHLNMIKIYLLVVVFSSRVASLSLNRNTGGFRRCQIASTCYTTCASPVEWNRCRTIACAAKTIGTELPVVTLKIALDAQGAVDDNSKGESWRFTGEASLDLVHRLRARVDAVAIGSGTVLRDNPSLTVRRVPHQKDQPLRVVFDRRYRTPSHSKILCDSHQTQFFVSESSARTEKLQSLKLTGKHVQPIPSASPGGLLVALSFLRNTREVHHLMVEGGALLARAFLNAGLVHRVILIKAPILFQDPVPSEINDCLLRESGLSKIGEYMLDDDAVECWSRPELPWPSTNLSDWP